MAAVRMLDPEILGDRDTDSKTGFAAIVMASTLRHSEIVSPSGALQKPVSGQRPDAVRGVKGISFNRPELRDAWQTGSASGTSRVPVSKHRGSPP